MADTYERDHYTMEDAIAQAVLALRDYHLYRGDTVEGLLHSAACKLATLLLCLGIRELLESLVAVSESDQSLKLSMPNARDLFIFKFETMVHGWREIRKKKALSFWMLNIDKQRGIDVYNEHFLPIMEIIINANNPTLGMIRSYIIKLHDISHTVPVERRNIPRASPPQREIVEISSDSSSGSTSPEIQLQQSEKYSSTSQETSEDTSEEMSVETSEETSEGTSDETSDESESTSRESSCKKCPLIQISMWQCQGGHKNIVRIRKQVPKEHKNEESGQPDGPASTSGSESKIQCAHLEETSEFPCMFTVAESMYGFHLTISQNSPNESKEPIVEVMEQLRHLPRDLQECALREYVAQMNERRRLPPPAELNDKVAQTQTDGMDSET